MIEGSFFGGWNRGDDQTRCENTEGSAGAVVLKRPEPSPTAKGQPNDEPTDGWWRSDPLERP